MSRLHRLLKPAVRLVRTALGMSNIELQLSAMQSQLSRVEAAMNQSTNEKSVNVNENQVSVSGARKHTIAFAPSYVSFSLPNGRSYELSIASSHGDAYLQAVASGVTQDATWKFVTDWTKEDDVFFDLGANIGTFTIPVAVTGAEVHAFELLHENVSHIADAVERNGLKNVSIVLGATWDSPGCVGFGGYSAWGAVYLNTPVSVATITVDDYVRQKQVQGVNTMKIDVEGSEKWALRGAADLINRDHPDIIIECNVVACGNNGYSYHELLSFLEQHGYSLYRFYKNRLCPCPSDVVQEVVYADYFATVKSPEQVRKKSGWEIAEMTQLDIIESIVEQDLYNEYHKAYVVANKDHFPSFVLSDNRVCELLKKWESMKDQPFFSALTVGSAPVHS